jgi:O-antigen biosynthesis protein
MKVVQLGTFDVNNFGDLLFPLIARQHLGDIPDFRLQAVSPVGGNVDLEDCEPCIGIHELAEDLHGFDAVLIGGGNIVHSSPTSLEEYRDGTRPMLAYADLWIGPTFLAPDGVPILWNAPGVPGPFAKEDHDLIRQALSRANYLSVRDEFSREYLLDVWPDAEIAVVPDSAWTVDRLWTRQELARSYAALFSRLQRAVPTRSVVFHVNRRYIGSSKFRLAQELDTIARRLAAEPLLIAMGPCHGDHVLTREIAAQMTTKPALLDVSRSLREVAACIAHANVYVGSSMHGLITASAFGVPGISVASGKVKFDGVAQLHGGMDVVASTWGAAREVVESLDLEKSKGRLGSVRDRAHAQLDVHWQRIGAFLKQNPSHRFATEARAPVHDFFAYQCASLMARINVSNREREASKRTHLEDLRATITASNALKKQLRKIQRDHSKLQQENRALRSEIDALRGSFSFRITRPLRYVARRLPRLAVVRKRVFDSAPVLSAGGLSHPEWTAPQDFNAQVQAYQSAPSGNRKIVFFTAIFGDYDTLLLPEQINPNVDYVCFTDRPRNDYGVWRMRAAPFHHPDATRIARYVKLHPHDLFPDYDVAVWLDANIILRGDIHKYVGVVRAEHGDLGLVSHPERECFYEEAEACKRLGKDTSAIIDAQVEHYRSRGLPVNQPLFETGFMIIDLKSEELQNAFRCWWQEIERFSRRDQLSLAWAIFEHPALKIVPLLPGGISVREHDDFRYHHHHIARGLAVPQALSDAGTIRDPFDEQAFSDCKADRLSKVIGIPVDIIVCVHNALEDVRLCLSSARRHLASGHRIIIINDCSDEPTTTYLRQFAAGDERVRLIENEGNLGYTGSANRGLVAGEAEFRILLNSDTIVSENWALKMLDVALRSEQIGIVGPLSNAAGAQSIPDIRSAGNNTAINVLAPGVTPAHVDLACESWSFAETLPRATLIHGFCFGVRKAVIERIGLFDDENFKRYFGEENDYCLRAAAAGFEGAIATNTFVFHRKSRSIEEQERLIHTAEAGKRLRELYGLEKIQEGCRQVEEHPLLVRMRAAAFDSGLIVAPPAGEQLRPNAAIQGSINRKLACL